eukprot:554874-Prymnesium_polylepis.1
MTSESFPANTASSASRWPVRNSEWPQCVRSRARARASHGGAASSAVGAEAGAAMSASMSRAARASSS